MVAKQKPAVYLNKSVRDYKASVKLSDILMFASFCVADLSEIISSLPLHSTRCRFPHHKSSQSHLY